MPGPKIDCYMLPCNGIIVSDAGQNFRESYFKPYQMGDANKF